MASDGFINCGKAVGRFVVFVNIIRCHKVILMGTYVNKTSRNMVLNT